MRKTFALLGLLAVALPVAAFAAPRVGEGTLSIEDGRGSVTIQARGGVIGRLDRGTVTIFDLSPGDAYEPVVTGDDQPIRFVGENGVRYAGAGIRFRLVGGGFRIVISGRGIDLSAVGKGSGVIQGETEEPGLYSLDGSDCRRSPEKCSPLPAIATRFQLAQNAREKGQPRPLRD